MKNNIFYYSNEDKRLARITRDFLSKFCSAVAEEFNSSTTIDFFKKTYIPKERELYGLFVKALMNFDLDETSQNNSRSIGHIGTEIKAKRISDKGDESTGRIDMLVTYRKTSFIIEFKVARTTLKNILNTDSPDKCKTLRPWISANQQIKDIDTDDLSKILNKRVIKLPVVIYTYADSHQDRHPDNWEELVNNKFNAIYNARAENQDIPEMQFSFLSCFEEPIRTQSRMKDSERANNFYGFSVIAADVE